MNSRPRALFLASVLLALSNSCSSGGGSGSSTSTSQSRVLILDTAVGGSYALDLRVDVAVLEAVDGTITDNLMPAGAVLPMARPSGASGGVRLPVVPTGSYVALRLLVAENGVRATDATGRPEIVVIPTRDLRVPLTGGVSVMDSTVRWLLLGSTSMPALLRNGSNQLTWTPALAARLGDAHALGSVDVTVVSVQNGTVLGSLSSCGDLPVNGRVDDRTALSNDGGMCDRSRFFADLRSGDHLECEGILIGSGDFRMSQAHRRGRGEVESKVYGRVVELQPSVPAIRVQAQEVVRGGAGLGSPLPVLTVLTAGAFIHHGSQRDVRLTFTALAVGQHVEVEWRGTVQNGTVTAQDVEIEDGSANGGGVGNEIEGQVQSVDLVQDLINAVPRGNDPLMVGGVSVPSATVVIGSQTVIYREDGTMHREVTLADARNGDHIWITGRVAAPQRVEASIVRLSTP